jgi:hypothetical protein
MRRLEPASVRAAVWTLRALASVRRELERGRLRDVEVPEPPRLPDSAIRGVHGALRRRRSTCLERSFVLQRWHAAHGDVRDVVIGVTTPAEFGAHAWLDGETAEQGPFVELSRIPLREPA